MVEVKYVREDVPAIFLVSPEGPEMVPLTASPKEFLLIHNANAAKWATLRAQVSGLIEWNAERANATDGFSHKP
jgi:hypothetical protein